MGPGVRTPYHTAMQDVRSLEVAARVEIRHEVARVAETALKSAAVLWFTVAVIGQWIFVYYMAAHYGGALARGELDRWGEATPHGYIRGDVLGNIAFALHIFLGLVVTFCGPLQLIPRLRELVPRFHHWNGRLFLVAAFAVAIDGLYLVHARGLVGGSSLEVSVSINGMLIILFGALALRHALSRDLDTHRRWALRLFLTVNGVWFFRVGMMSWILVNGRPAGIDMETLQGPFITFWGFGQYLLPLAVLEVYLRVRRRGAASHRFAMAGALLVLTLVMGLGIAGALMGMWLPRL